MDCAHQTLSKTGVTGTTTATNTAVVTIDTRGCGPQGKLLILISNLSGSDTMYYQINGYPSDESRGSNGGLYVGVKAQTSIAASTQVISTDVDKNYAAVVILVQNNSGACNYQIDYSTY